MTAASAVQWTILLALLAGFLFTLGAVLPGPSSRGAYLGSAISAGLAFFLYFLAIVVLH